MLKSIETDHIQSGLKEDMWLLLIHGLEIWIRKQETLREYRKGNPTLIEDNTIDGTSMVSHLPQLPQRHTSQMNHCKMSQHGAHASQANKCEGQWSRWASDIRQAQPDQWSSSSSRWHSSAGDERSWRRKSYWEESNWFPPTRKTLKGSEYDTDQEWHLRNMQYGDGWAYDSTQSHYKRAKPTYTDPEDDKMTDSSLPIGLTSKTYGPKKDGSFWQRRDGSQDWSYSLSATGQWKPRLRHEKSFSSAAGDTF